MKVIVELFISPVDRRVTSGIGGIGNSLVLYWRQSDSQGVRRFQATRVRRVSSCSISHIHWDWVMLLRVWVSGQAEIIEKPMQWFWGFADSATKRLKVARL